MAAPLPGTPASPRRPPARCARWGPLRQGCGVPLCEKEKRETEEDKKKKKGGGRLPMGGEPRAPHQTHQTSPRTSTKKSLRVSVPSPRARQV